MPITATDMDILTTIAETRAAIRALRTRLISHWLGCPEAVFADAMTKAGGLGAAIEMLRAQGLCRLRPIPVRPLNSFATLIATFHLGDPVGPRDSWRPWRRRLSL